MGKLLLTLGILVLISACKSDIDKPILNTIDFKDSLDVIYSNGFTIKYLDTYKTITISNPWPGADKVFTYALTRDKSSIPPSEKYDAIVQIPVNSIVVTSTTHIPSLEMLGVENSLTGFPNLNYISSEKTRKRIDAGEVTELGKNEDINTEVLIDLAPDLVVGFGVDGSNSTFETIEKTGIPVVYNGDWTETTPLGKAEWIKFFAAFFDKEKEADSIFNSIVSEYNLTKSLAAKTTFKPSVLSGAMYKDVWYLPQGDSWAAKFIEDANGNYLWNDSQGTGSLSLNLEAVLERGQFADYWIGPGQFTSQQQLLDNHSVYGQFEAFKRSNIFSFTNKKGATGGVLYYELAPNRPDLVLKDIVKILHPELLKDHEFYFFSHIN